MKTKRKAGFLIAKIHQISGRILSKKLKECCIDDINPAQGRILFVLWQRDNVPIQDLSKKTFLEKSTLTSMLDRLGKSGYIVREPSKDDRRKIYIKLTDKNKKLEKLYKQVSDEMISLFFNGMTKKEIDVFEDKLTLILNNLTTYKF